MRGGQVANEIKQTFSDAEDLESKVSMKGAKTVEMQVRLVASEEHVART